MTGNVNQENFANPVALFHYRKNKWRLSPKHLELDICLMGCISQELVVFAILIYPVTTIIFKEDLDEDPETKI